MSSSEKAAFIVAFIVVALILGLLTAMMSRALGRIQTLENGLYTLNRRLNEKRVFDEKE